jgi:hypothetical protein
MKGLAPAPSLDQARRGLLRNVRIHLYSANKDIKKKWKKQQEVALFSSLMNLFLL